ncbi:unnamed protein product [Amaranthus hypochondriacus]
MGSRERKVSERGRKVFAGFEFQIATGRRRVLSANSFHGHHFQRQPWHGKTVGLRGWVNNQWRRGPWVSPLHRAAQNFNLVISLFIDGIPSNTSTKFLWWLFQKEGMVLDVYISKKRRANKKEGFGFVRFKNIKDAEKAIVNLDGVKLANSKIRVSMAKYKKNGTPFMHHPYFNNFKTNRSSGIGSQVVRASRNVADEVRGKSSQAEQVGLASKSLPDSTVQDIENQKIAETGSRTFEQSHTVTRHGGEEITVIPTLNSSENDKGENVVKMAALKATSEILPQSVALTVIPTIFGSSSMDSRSPLEEALTVAQSVAPIPVVDGDTKNTIDSEKNSATKKQIRKDTVGNLVKNRPCRAAILKRSMNIKEIHNFLGYYGPTKA